MIRVTWAWLGQTPALDLANTVAVENGLERDLLAPDRAFERWVAAEGAASSLGPKELTALLEAKREVLAIRTSIRKALAAVAAETRPPAAAIGSLNAASRAHRSGWSSIQERAASR